MERTGILLTDENDLDIAPVRDSTGLILSGLQIGRTDLQNIDLIVSSAKGEFKEYPVLGVSPEMFLKSVGKERDFIREVTVQLGLDGYNADVKIVDGSLKIEI